MVIVDCQGRTKVLAETDLAEFDNSRVMMGEAPRLVAFKGEQALTSAILEVSEARQKTLYYLTGHGETGLDAASPLTGIVTFIKRQNVGLKELSLPDVDAIPDDADVVLLAGSKYDLPEREIRVLKTYWEKQGRLMVLLDPLAKIPELKKFLSVYGVTPNDDQVLRTVDLGPLTGILRDVSADFIGGNAITKPLEGASALFLGGARSLRIDRERVQGQSIQIWVLTQAADGFWGETDYEPGSNDPVSFDNSKDLGAPLTLAITIEKGGIPDERVQVSSSRMVVVGSSAFITNEALTDANLDFFLNSLNWLLERERLISIAPKEVNTFSLNLSDRQMSSLAIISMLVMPFGAALLGVVVWWTRRR